MHQKNERVKQQKSQMPYATEEKSTNDEQF